MDPTIFPVGIETLNQRVEQLEEVKITVSATEPPSPSVNDLWVDIS